MKRLAFFLFALIFGLVVSCQQPTTTEEPTTSLDSLSTAEPTPPSLPDYFEAQQKELLEQYFPKTLVAELDKNLSAFHHATTDAAFETAFLAAQELQAQLEAQVNPKPMASQIIEALEPLNSLLLPYVPSCSEECQLFAFTFSTASFKSIAQKTTGKSDDRLGELILLASGDYGGRPKLWYNFFQMMMDYQGGAVLGNGLCLDFLQQSWQHIQTTPLFKVHVRMLRAQCIQDMQHNNYMLPKDSVVHELQSILDQQILTLEESQTLQQLQEKLTSDESNAQFDCQSGNCTFL